MLEQNVFLVNLKMHQQLLHKMMLLEKMPSLCKIFIQYSALYLQKVLLAGEVQAYNLKLISLFQADSWFVVLIERGRKQGGGFVEECGLCQPKPYFHLLFAPVFQQ